MEGIVYYIGVGIIEELYLRGLLQSIIEKWFGERKNATLYAILIASVLFGLGHIFGALGQPIVTVIAKTVWTTALGIYFGAVYVMSKNLWVIKSYACVYRSNDIFYFCKNSTTCSKCIPWEAFTKMLSPGFKILCSFSSISSLV